MFAYVFCLIKVWLLRNAKQTAEAGTHWKHIIVKTLIHAFKCLQEANWLEDPILFIVKLSRKQDLESPTFSPQRNSNFMSHHPMISLQGQIRKCFCSSLPFLATQGNFLTIKRCPNQISICRQCIWVLNSRLKPEMWPFASFDWHTLGVSHLRGNCMFWGSLSGPRFLQFDSLVPTPHTSYLFRNH